METLKRLSCKRCQARKIKCNRRQPCGNCAHSGHQCEYRNNDTRRPPVPHRYLEALETRLAWYESFVRKLKASSASERDALLRDVSCESHAEGDMFASSNVDQPTPHNSMLIASEQSVSLQYHGPTSMYVDETTKCREQMTASGAIAHIDDGSKMRLALTLGIDSALVHACLPLFFLYQYPQMMFVYREAFLSDYFENARNGKYWSYPLLYAICALGAAHSADPSVRGKAYVLAKCAEEIIVTYELARSHPTTIQALLCLAFYEIGQGNASKGWLFAGMSFRMGQDIGFHRDPIHWVSQDQTIATPEDIEIRRRIYWGCYIADKFISLYLGRPVYLNEKDAAVQPSEPLPDFSSEHRWFGLSALAAKYSELSPAQRPRLTAAFKHMVTLGNIFQDTLADIFSVKEPRDGRSFHGQRLNDLNVRLNRWIVDLPVYLQWSQWSAQDQPLQQHIIILHLTYHSICLSLNRHFIRQGTDASFQESSKSICESSCNSVIAMIRQSRNQRGIRKSPLIFVYALVMTMITLDKISDSVPQDPRYAFLLKTLSECSHVYKIAAEAHSRFKAHTTAHALSEPRNTNLGHELPTARQSAQDTMSSANGIERLSDTRQPQEDGFQTFIHHAEQNSQGNNILNAAWPPLSDPLMDEIGDLPMPPDPEPMDSLLLGQSPELLNWEDFSNICEMTGDFRGWFSLGDSS